MSDSYDTHHPSGHEPDTTNVGGVTLVAVVLAVVVAIVIIAMPWFEAGFRPIAGPLRAAAPSPTPGPETRRIYHWQNPSIDLADVRSRELAHLRGYGWVDRDAGIVHIPIERAMELVGRSGLQPAEAPPPAAEGSVTP